jgi:antitoxin component YwqK of YwqJK toxin-antitoxin module
MLQKTFFNIGVAVFLVGFLQAQEVKKKIMNQNPEVRIIAEVLKKDERIPHGSFEQQYQAKRQVLGRYDNGKRIGKWTRYFQTGETMIVGFYQNGVPSGTWKRFDKSGEEVASFSFENGTPSGHWHGTYFNGNNAIDMVYGSRGFLTQAVLYYFNERPGYLLDQEMRGKDTLSYRSLYFKNQTIEEYKETKNTQLNGRLIKYHPTGARWEEYEYKENRLKEVVAMRAQTGQPLVVGSFEEGTGRINSYYPNGMIYKRQEYKDGVPHGFVTYEQSGRELGYGEYKNGKRTGKWVFRNALEFPEIELEYDNNTGDTVQVVRRISANMHEAEKGTLVNGVRHGEWYQTNIMKDTTEIATFNNGLLDGSFTKFTLNIGNVEALGAYFGGTRSGIWEIYNPFNQQTERDSIFGEPSFSFDITNSPVPGWTPIQEAFGYYFISEDVYGQAVISKDIIHYIPKYPGVELLETPLNYDFQVVEPLVPQQGDDYSYRPLFVSAEFPEGYESELLYLVRHKDLEVKSDQMGVSGSVLIGMRIDRFGLIEEVEILRGIDPKFDQSVQQFIEQMPVWSPATYNGIPIPSYVVKRMDFPVTPMR